MRDDNVSGIRKRLERFVTDRDVPLIRLMLYTRWFKWALLLMLLIILSLPATLIKFHRVTPEEFKPEVKISFLDVLQSWSLRRGALKMMAEDKFDDSVHAWHSSIANHPGNVDYMREYFHFLMEHDLRKSKSKDAAQNGMWFLRITQTNHTDAQLLAEVFDFYDLHTYNHYLLNTLEGDLSVDLEKKYLKTLFHAGTVEDFRDRLSKLSEEDISSDSELKLYRAAYLAAWGPPETALDNLEMVRSKLEDSEFGPLAHILNIQISHARSEVDQYKTSLDFLVSTGKDTLMHHLNYWAILMQEGRKSEAIELLRRYNFPAKNATEVAYFGELASSLGEEELSLQFLSTFASDYGYHEPVWFVYTQLLTSMEKWPELRQAALMIRNARGVTDSLIGLSQYMEARAAIGENRRGTAERLVGKIVQHQYDYPKTGFLIGKGLGDHGFPMHALSVLNTLESELKDNTEYWETIFTIGSRGGMRDSLFKAAENLYRLDSNNRAYANNYAAMLLSERIKPEIAISLTYELMTRDKEVNIAAVINHALALVLNQRFDEAVEYMGKISNESLPAEYLPGL
jgi:tetratricopeptide (TPR) repeat protein